MEDYPNKHQVNKKKWQHKYILNVMNSKETRGRSGFLTHPIRIEL